MEHEPAAQLPLPAVKSQRHFPVLWMAAMFCLMLINTGCVSYHVSAARKRPDARSYALVDHQLKRNINSCYQGSGLSLIGATESGFTHIENLAGTNYDGSTPARARTRRWEEIQDVRVRAFFPFIMVGGLFDPTIGSSVELKFHDGKNLSLTAFPPEIGGIVPFWLFMSCWGKAHQTAVAIQTMVDSQKQNTGTTTLKNP